MSLAQGGRFEHGFVAAGIAKAANVNGISEGDTSASAIATRVAAAALIGGTASRITGGKFANGAMTAALAQAVNGEQEQKRQSLYEQMKMADLQDWYKEFMAQHPLEYSLWKEYASEIYLPDFSALSTEAEYLQAFKEHKGAILGFNSYAQRRSRDLTTEFVGNQGKELYGLTSMVGRIPGKVGRIASVWSGSDTVISLSTTTAPQAQRIIRNGTQVINRVFYEEVYGQ